jgi:hypothetical protein
MHFRQFRLARREFVETAEIGVHDKAGDHRPQFAWITGDGRECVWWQAGQRTLRCVEMVFGAAQIHGPGP